MRSLAARRNQSPKGGFISPGRKSWVKKQADNESRKGRHPKTSYTNEMRQIPKLVALQLLRGYKWMISPMLPPSCRYVPTCSEYAMEAIERYGALRGSWMAFNRILRCHPFVRGGHDPVVKRGPTTSDQRPTTISDCSLQGHF